MPEIPDVGAIAQQVKARIKHIEDQLKQHDKLSEELERLRGRVEPPGRWSAIARRRSAPQPQAHAQPAPRATKPASATAPAPRSPRPRRRAPARSEQGQGARRAEGRPDDGVGDLQGHRHPHRHCQHAAHQVGQVGRARQSRTRLQAAAIATTQLARSPGGQVVVTNVSRLPTTSGPVPDHPGTGPNGAARGSSWCGSARPCRGGRPRRNGGEGWRDIPGRRR